MTFSDWFQILTGTLGALGFALMYHIRGLRMMMATVGGFLSYTLFLLLGFLIPGETVRYFLVAALVSLYAEVLARVMKTPTTTFIMTSLIPLIPGGSLYYTITSAFEGNWGDFLEKGLYTLKLAAALALGIVVISAFARLIARLTEKWSSSRRS